MTDLPAPGPHNLPEHEYHAHPAMSSTQARRILPPKGCPALVDHDRTHPEEQKDAWDLGTTVHKLVLGKGTQLVEIPTDTWRTKGATEARDEARAEGHVALLSKDMRIAEAMRDQIQAHPIAGHLLTPTTFLPEQCFFWTDPDTGIHRRAMLDATIPNPPSGRPIVIDVKTTQDASPDHIRRAVADFGYHQQGAWYLDAIESWTGTGLDPIFLLIFVSSKAPHLVTVAELDPETLDAGRHANRAAINTWARCQETGVWPGYDNTRIHTITLPPWATYIEEDTL